MSDRFFSIASGREPADLRIDNVRIVDVFNGTVKEGCVCIGEGRIAGFSRMEAREVFNGRGGYLLPGLIDAHVHIESSMLTPGRFAEMVVPFGTTTVVADPHEIANVAGMAGIRYMLEASEDIPLDVKIMLPSCVPALPVEDAGAVLGADDIRSLMSQAGVGGLAEMMNVPGVLGGDPDVHGKIACAKALGKAVDGHAPMLEGVGLDAYAAAGVMTDHECTTAAEVVERISDGMYAVLREGSAARNLKALLPAVTPENSRRCIFCTDDAQPADVLARGHMDKHLRMAVEYGLDPITAIRMATLNTAECYGLSDRGAIAPGRRADLVLMEDLQSFRAMACWNGGHLVARDGRMLVKAGLKDASVLRSSVNIKLPAGRVFSVKAPSGRARIIGLQPHSLVTDCLERNVVVGKDGEVELHANRDLLKIAVIERHHATGRMATALLDGRYGLSGGAIATTIAHDSHNIVVAGDNEDDMLAAVREIERIGGGIVMVSKGTVLDELPLPIGGLMTDLPAEDAARAVKRLLGLASTHYNIWEGADAFMTLSFLALPVIPHLKITARGLFSLEEFSFLSVDAGKQPC